MYYDDDYPDCPDDWEDDDRSAFADPGGESSLQAETSSNPRNLPCGQCGRENMLTPKDKHRGYVCDSCANQNERGW
jgi:hypothetical protein